jgi:predicted metalloprotease with PDZ domain
MMSSPDLEVLEVPTARTRLRVATFGSFGFTAEDFAFAARKAIAAEQAFWRDSQPHFLVALAPLRVPGGEAMQGVNLNDAFALVASPGIGLDQLTPVLAHEYFHTWDPFRLGGPEQGGMSGAWFVEGFTDYYARRLALRGGVSGLQTFADQWNTALTAYAASPKINASNAQVAAGFWRDHNLQQMAYNRGAVFAAWLEAQWRPAGVSLDQVMITMREQARKDRDPGKTPFSGRLEAAAQVYGVSARDGVGRFIQRGETITLPQDAFGACLTL